MNVKLRWVVILVVVLLVGGLAIVPAQAAVAAEAEFKNLFDGKTLDGWKAADMSYWSVEDGAITGKITEEHPLKENLYLIWQGGELADFELKLKSRVFGSKDINNGFQFRSKELPNHDVAGYQVDNNLNTDWLVRLYDEHGRHDLAWRGQRTVFDESGKATNTEIPEAKGAPWFKLEEWHEYHLICDGTASHAQSGRPPGCRSHRQRSQPARLVRHPGAATAHRPTHDGAVQRYSTQDSQDRRRQSVITMHRRLDIGHPPHT